MRLLHFQLDKLEVYSKELVMRIPFMLPIFTILVLCNSFVNNQYFILKFHDYVYDIYVLLLY